MLSGAVLSEYLERLVPLQGAVAENLDRLNEIKRDARSDGADLDALNALLPILSKYPHDKGARVLNEIIRYAEAFGVESLVSKADADSQAPAEPTPEAQVSQPATAGIPWLAESRRRSTAFAGLRLSAQVVVAVGLSTGLIWLLN